MPNDRHQRGHAGASTDKKKRTAIDFAPDEVAAERTADLDRVARLRNVMEEQRDFAALKSLDRKLIGALRIGCRCNGLTPQGLVTIRSGEANVQMLAGPE